MQQDNFQKSLIAGRDLISENQGALSLVRKFGAQHAYLVLERLKEGGQRYTVDAHLVIKQGTEDAPRPLGDIVYREITLVDLMKLSEGCHSVTWGVSEDQMETFEKIIEDQQTRAAENKIEYLVFGKAAAAGLFGVSLQQSHSEALEAWSVANKKGSVSDYLLRKGHNCYSWALSVVLNIGGLNPPHEGFLKCVVRAPHGVIEGTKDGDAEEPTTGFRCILS